MKPETKERGLFSVERRSVTHEDYERYGREKVEAFRAAHPAPKTIGELLAGAEAQALAVYAHHGFDADQAPSIDPFDWPADFYFAHSMLNAIYHLRRLLALETLSAKDGRFLFNMATQLTAARVKLSANAHPIVEKGQRFGGTAGGEASGEGRRAKAIEQKNADLETAARTLLKLRKPNSVRRWTREDIVNRSDLSMNRVRTLSMKKIETLADALSAQK